VGEILPDSRYEVVLNFGSNENERIIEISKL